MASTVTIEGSITPSAALGRGQRRTVRMTDRVQKLIDKGFVILVEEAAEELPLHHYADAAAAADSPMKLDSPPGLNASREHWARWLTANHVAYPDGADRPDGVTDHVAGRDELIAIWEQQTADGV